MAVPQQTFEPRQITAGDTLSWTRYFSNFPASAGWFLDYELRGEGQAISFQSTANGDSHVILVTAATTAVWLPQQYVFEGFAINTALAQRQRIFFNNLFIGINLPTSAADVDVKTHAQNMLELIESVQLGKYKNDILESDVEGTKIIRLSPSELRKEYLYWKNERMNEIRAANARAGRSNGRNRFEVFVDPAGGGAAQFGALPPPIWPFGGQAQ